MSPPDLTSSFRPLAAIATVAAALLFSGGATAQRGDGSPVLHEFVPDSVTEDLKLATTDATGQLPSALNTPSGVIRPPDLSMFKRPDQTYHQQGGIEQSFTPDRDTSRPTVERYDDPFSPALTPFKRLYAYDSVDANYRLRVRNTKRSKIPTGGEVTSADDRFFGDLSVQVVAGEYVRIPTVGPDARIINLVVTPRQSVDFWRDGADNWYVRAAESGRVRLVAEYAVERATFASEYPDVSWHSLPAVTRPPAKQRAAYLKVAETIGISRRMRPRQIVAKMVAYFRSFGPSDDSPNTQGDIYLDLALSQKGVCRHRSFAFLVTALHIGIPTRLVHNEAHAWVEVRDDKQWHRIDLGGAANYLDDQPELDRPPHVPPPDQFRWPSGRDSGEELARRNRQEAQAQAGAEPVDPTAPATAASGTAADAPPVMFDPDAPGQPDPQASGGPTTEVTLERMDEDVFRGLPFRVRGKATADGEVCASQRVDVILVVEGEPRPRFLGSLSTDKNGGYDGEVMIPSDVAAGDHDLVVSTPGGARCGAGQLR